MSLVGTAEVLIKPESAGFASRLEAQTQPALNEFQARAGVAGERAGAELNAGMAKGTGAIRKSLELLGLPVGLLGSNLNKVGGEIASVDAKSKGLGATMAGLGGNIVGGAAVAFGVAGAAGIDFALKGEKVTRSIQAQAAISESAAKGIMNSFRTTAGETIFSARQMGEAYAGVAAELGAAEGHALKSSEALKVMKAAGDLAVGTGGDLNAITETLAKTMLVYGQGASSAAGDTDILFNASRLTGTSVESVGQILDRIRGKLGSLSPSLGESAALMASLAKQGLQGRLAMSALNGAFTTLIGGGKKTEEMAKALGITIFDQNHHFVGLRSIIEQLQPKLAGMGEQQQLEATKALFGSQANKQLLSVVLQGPAAYDANTHAVTRAGSAHQAAEIQSKSLQHQWEIMKATVVDLAERLGQFLIPKLTAVVNAVVSVIDWFKKHEAAAKALAAVIVTVLGAALGAFAFDKAAQAIDATKRMITAFGDLGAKLLTYLVPAFQTAEGEIVAGTDATAVSVDAALIGTGIGAAVVALGIAAFELKEHWEEVMQAMESITATAANFIIEQLEAVSFGLISLGKVATAAEEEAENKKIKEHNSEIHQEERAGEGKAPTTEFGNAGEQERSRSIIAFFESKGLTEAQAAGIAGNVRQESQYSPTAASGSHRGLFQGEPGRPVGKAQGAYAQLEAAWKELATNPEFGLAQLKKAKTAGEAAKIFAAHFEKMGKSEEGPRSEYAEASLKDYQKAYHTGTGAQKHLTKAVQHGSSAQEAYNKALEEATEAVGKKAKKPSHSKEAAARKAEEQYVNPFGASPFQITSRDDGLDFAAKAGTKIQAIGTGYIDKIIANWYKGQPLVEEKLTKGKRAGQEVYYAEQLNPNVREGQRVQVGQEIGRVAASGTGLEFGFGGGGGRTLAQARGERQGELPPRGTVAGQEYEKFFGSLKKGSASLETASAEFKLRSKEMATAVKLEQKAMAADKKAGEKELNSLETAISNSSLKDLSNKVGFQHEAGFHALIEKLSHDHVAGMGALVHELTKVHKAALAELGHLEQKQWEAGQAKEEARADKIHTEEADAKVKAIEDATRVSFDKMAQAGLSGAELTAAEARTDLDVVTQNTDAQIASARLALDKIEGVGGIAEASAKTTLANAEDAGKVAVAEAKQRLEFAERKAQEAEKRAQEKEGKTAATAPPSPHTFNIVINGASLTPAELIKELGWELKTGGLTPVTA